MKNFKVLLFALLITFFACKKKEVTPETITAEEVTTANFNIVNKWSVINTRGMFAGETFQLGDVIYDFQSNGSLIVTSKVVFSDYSGVPAKNSTVYEFKNNTLKIDNSTYGCFIDKGHLILDGGSAYDGPRIELVKIK